MNSWHVISFFKELEVICLHTSMGLLNTSTASLQGGKIPPNECPGYDIKQSDCEVPMMPEL